MVQYLTSKEGNALVGPAVLREDPRLDAGHMGLAIPRDFRVVEMHDAIAGDLVLAVTVGDDTGEAGGGVDNFANEGSVLDAVRDPDVNRIKFAYEVPPLYFVEFSRIDDFLVDLGSHNLFRRNHPILIFGFFSCQ